MKKTVVLISALWAMLTLNAENISLKKAEQLATNYVVSQFGSLRKSNVNLTLKHIAKPEKNAKKTNKETVYYYVFNIDKTGFIIVSGDDVAKPVLGYSENGNFDVDNLPPGLEDLLNLYQSQIAHAQAENTPQSEEIRKQWESYLAGNIANAGAIVGPLVKTKWDQGSPYNALCPLVGGKRSITGCVATAMAQIMNYHEFPQTGIGSAGAYALNSNDKVPLVNLEVDYDWNNMLDVYTNNATEQQRNSVATLMYHCGVSVFMAYSPSSSGARSTNAIQAFTKNFGYEGSLKNYQRDDYLTQWDAMLKTQIDVGLPILYGGSASWGAHAFVCDGYDGDGKFHFNFGWSGSSDGFYATTALHEFQGNQHAIMDIKPVQGLMKNLQVSEGTLSPKFRPYIFNYNVSVDESVESIDVSGFTDLPDVTVEGNVTNLPLPLNQSVDVKITATRADGSKQTYRITVLRGKEPPFSFRWDMTEYSNTPTIGILTESGKPCVIDWGDGKTQTVEGNNTGNYNIAHTYSTPGAYQVTVRSTDENAKYTPVLTFRKRCGSGYPIRDINFRSAYKMNNIQMDYFDDTVLDLSQQRELSILMCTNGKLSTLDVSASNLSDLYCGDNALSLISLHNLSQQTQGIRDRALGTQTLPNVHTTVGISIAIDTVFYGENTQMTAQGKTNCTFENGKITFHSSGTYTITLTNPAIVDESSNVQIRQTFIVTSDRSKYTVNVETPSNGRIEILEAQTPIYTGTQIDSGVVLMLTATPNRNYEFVQWWDNNTENPRQITLTQNVSISATFKSSGSGTADEWTMDNGQWTIYPNPVVDELRIKNYELRVGDIVEIYDLNGNRVYSAQPLSIVHCSLTIDVSHLPAGMYIVRIGKRSAKIVKH